MSKIAKKDITKRSLKQLNSRKENKFRIQNPTLPKPVCAGGVLSKITDFPNPSASKRKNKKSEARLLPHQRRMLQMIYSSSFKDMESKIKTRAEIGITDLLETTQNRYYFQKILSITPPKNEATPLFVNADNRRDGTPLLILIYEGILGFTNNSGNVVTNQHSFDILRKLAMQFSVAIVLPNREEKYLDIADEIKQMLGARMFGIFYTRLQNKKTKTLYLKNIFKYIKSDMGEQRVLYLMPLMTDPKELASRKICGSKFHVDGTKIQDCKVLGFEDLWTNQPIFPLIDEEDSIELVLCYYPHLIYAQPNKLRKGSPPGFSNCYEDLDITLKNIYLNILSNVKEYLIPDLYKSLLHEYSRESLCEHHAILRLILGGSDNRITEADIDNYGMMFDYRKLTLLQKLREVGAEEENMNDALTLLKRNSRNLSALTYSTQIGETVDGTKIEIYEELKEFSGYLAVRNLDLGAITAHSGAIFLV